MFNTHKVGRIITRKRKTFDCSKWLISYMSNAQPYGSPMVVVAVVSYLGKEYMYKHLLTNVASDKKNTYVHARSIDIFIFYSHVNISVADSWTSQYYKSAATDFLYKMYGSPDLFRHCLTFYVSTMFIDRYSFFFRITHCHNSHNTNSRI